MGTGHSFAEITLDKLREQSKVSERIQLRNADGSLSQTTLNLNLQWIYSKVSYLTSVIKKWDHHILQEQRSWQSEIYDLNILYAPFMGLKKQEIVVQGQKTPYNPDPILVNDERGFKKVDTGNVSCIMVTLYWFVVVWWVLSMMNCYYKACFLDVMLSLLYLSSVYFNQPEFNENVAYTFIGLICLSII